jgi:thiol:disulfide interchange protein DsbA
MSRLLPLFLLALSLAAGPARSEALEQKPLFEIEGWYERIQPPQPTSSADKVEVIEVFAYTCSHCFHFQPFITGWEKNKPPYVEFSRIPAVFHASWTPYAKAYYTAELLQVLDRIHIPLFRALHLQQKKLDSKEALMAFFMEQGLPKEKFNPIYDAPGVEIMIQRSIQKLKNYGIDGTPSLVINGKYRTSGSLAGSFENMIKVLDILVAKEHQEAMAAQ